MGALVYILRRMQATQPDACVLRPALREEARKAIGAMLPSAQLPRPCCAGHLMRIRRKIFLFLFSTQILLEVGNAALDLCWSHKHYIVYVVFLSHCIEGRPSPLPWLLS